MSEIANLDKVISEIDRAKSIAIICHVNPDGDTLGSGFALYNSLKMYGKTPYIFCTNAPSDSLRREIPLIDELNLDIDIKPELTIAVDAASYDMLGEMAPIFDRAKRRIVLDHHMTNTRYGDINVVDPKAAAAAEVVYELLVKMNEVRECIDSVSARLLYLALVTDSGAFSFDSVTSHTLYVASELIKYDFSASDIIFNLMKSKRLSVFKLTHRVLDKAKFFDSEKIGVVTFRKADFEATGTTMKDTEGIINNLINIDKVMVAIAISEVDSTSYKLSIRTKDPIDASNIATFFGGGGHARAAGLKLNGYYEDVLDTIVRHATIELGD